MTEHSERISILQPIGPSASSCGYCSPKGKRSEGKTSKSYGAWGHIISSSTYKDLLDRGWRRSGEYLYKPDMARSCCPSYTISLDAASFRPSRSQRQVLQRFNAFVQTGEREGQPGFGPAAAVVEGEDDVKMGEPAKGKKDKGKGRANQASTEDWGEAVTAAEWAKSPEDQPFRHRFEYILEPASFSEEKYQLYRRYQMDVHGDAATKVKPDGFRRFLCDTPLEIEPTKSPRHSHGSFHALYKLDSKIIAIAVLDLLPSAVSSVYFIWDPDYAGLSLGKLSALREAYMVREMQKDDAWGENAEGRYMMGFYIHTCPKMRYKAEYQPSFLLDPATNVYYPWATCKPLLDVASPGVASFSQPIPVTSTPAPPSPSSTSTNSPSSSTSIDDPSANPDAEAASSDSEEDDEEDDDDEPPFPSPPPLGCYDPDKLPKELLMTTYVIEKRTLVPFVLSAAWRNPITQQEARELLAVTGDAARGKIAVYTGK